MNPSYKVWICRILLGAVALTYPLSVSAQEMDLTAERAEEEPEEEEELQVDEVFLKPANTWPKGSYVLIDPGSGNGSHLGPTGLWGLSCGQNIRVKKVDPGSPADGKVLPDDIIYGTKGKVFPAECKVKYSFAMAITEAETQEAGGKLILDIRRDGKLIQVPIQLQVMGSFSSTTPWNCEKSKNIVARAEEYMRKGLRPETGLPNNGEYMYGPWNDGVLFLLAAGNPELQGLVRRYIHNTIEGLDAWKTWNQESGKAFNPYGGWGFAYLQMLYGEYYHLTGDPAVLPYLEALCNGTFNRGPNPNRPEAKPAAKQGMDWTWPPTKPTGLGTHPGGQMAGTMGGVLANEAGLNINKDKLMFNIKYLYVKRAEYGWVKYNGYGAQPLSNRQTDKPMEITPEEKRTGMCSSYNGKMGTAAALFSMVTGGQKAVEMCSERCVYAFNHTNKGHGGIWFNNFWTPIGAHHAGPEKFTQFMKGQQWCRELYRDHTGAMWQRGNAKEKMSVLGTGFAIHRAIPRQKLRMFGAPRSMFGPDAPAYMKEALAAHRNRDYARAEQLTLQLQASGKVPATDKARASHFLNSVQTLKKSIDYDLTFTEALLAKKNYILAEIEMSQLKMVASSNNPRLKAIIQSLESTQVKTQLASAKAQAAKKGLEARKAQGAAKEALKEDFKKEVASILALTKDGTTYNGPKGTRRGTHYPIYRKPDLHRWRIHVTKDIMKAPDGWEQPTFDDSRWKEVTLPTSWQTQSGALLRTSFEVKDVSAFKSLRIRAAAHSQSNLTLYLNGEVVARGAIIPGSLLFDLKPASLTLLKKGKNTLAISTQRGWNKQAGFGFRLEGILKDPSSKVRGLPDIDDMPDLF